MISLGNRNAKHAVTDEELSAFADGQLPPHRARRVAAEIRAHPRFADRIYAYWRREAALWRALDPVFQESVPQIEAPRARRWPAAAALIVAAVVPCIEITTTARAFISSTSLAVASAMASPNGRLLRSSVTAPG